MNAVIPEDVFAPLGDARKDELRRNFEDVASRVDAACRRSGMSGVTMVAATKYATVAEINFAARELGLRTIGENRVQALCAKAPAFDPSLEIQFIGSLQTNKVRQVLGKVSLIQSLDSLHLAEEIEAQSAKADRVTDVLLEVNSGEEDNKGGILPAELPAVLGDILALPHIRICGIMTMAPVLPDPEDYRPYFSATRKLFDDHIAGRADILHKLGGRQPILSMGMTNSFETAIECGATMIRVGSALFGRA